MGVGVVIVAVCVDFSLFIIVGTFVLLDLCVQFLCLLLCFTCLCFLLAAELTGSCVCYL